MQGPFRAAGRIRPVLTASHAKNTNVLAAIPALCAGFVGLAALLFPALPAFGQTAADLERLLDTPALTCGDAAYFTLASVMDEPPGGPSAAFALALERGWLPAGAGPGGLITLRTLSLLMMKSFNLEGGLLYRLFPGPRYAYREMTGQGFIEGRAYPGLTVSGERFLRILGSLLSHTGDADIPVPAAQTAQAAVPAAPAAALPAAAEPAPAPAEPVIVFEETETNIVIEDTARGRTVRLLNAVYFGADSAVPIGDFRSVLDELGALLASRPDAAVVLRAYTAPYGTREGRLEISRNRAAFCRDYLQGAYRIAADRIEIELYGADQIPEWGRSPDGTFVAVESFRCVEFILHE
jgi:outer membrane protein OmpA-like peptidoglycan-associated protein